MTVLVRTAEDARAETEPVSDDYATDGPPDPTHRRWPVSCLTIALVALAIVWPSWLLTGGGLFFVGSPSMGTAAPVGSLVVTQPLTPSTKLRVGQVIVFQPQPGRSPTYVHRIYEVLPKHQYLTKGDLNQGPDPWVITRGDVIGTANLVIPAIGWIYKCATWLFLGAAVLVVVSLFVGKPQRQWILALGPIVLLVVPLIRYRPFIGGYLYGSGRRGHQVAAKVVDTGILPVHFTPSAGPAVHAVPGQEVVVSGVTPKQAPSLDISIRAALPWWGWALVILACLTPLTMVAHEYLLRRRERPEGRPADDPAGIETPVSASEGVLTTAL